ncbi:hypothetical protein QE152_g34504 [Popillia japonica]|uniref:Uncharacterized protein n=1 Tax=Popillia japonica TaxID=7064 RepID=A0AAW1ITK2_POPJA
MARRHLTQKELEEIATNIHDDDDMLDMSDPDTDSEDDPNYSPSSDNTVITTNSASSAVLTASYIAMCEESSSSSDESSSSSSDEEILLCLSYHLNKSSKKVPVRAMKAAVAVAMKKFCYVYPII